ncbi:MAG: leucine-rich repeat domain-containing protein [Alphaproteobacteria bacterium]|nr:leucine-rich repeat domain-containing protein [Alphaproteobacteria bacterium]
MKNKIFILNLIGAVHLSFNALAECQTEGYDDCGTDCGEHCSWYIKDGVLTLTGYGEIKSYDRNYTDISTWACPCSTTAPWGQYSDSVSKIVIENQSATQTFTSIGNHAFENMEHTTEVVLPDGLTSIGREAFNQNFLLEKINWPDTLRTIGWQSFGFSSLSTLDLPEGLTTIEARAFCNNENLTNVVLPESLTTLHSGAFGNPSKPNTPLETLYCSENLREQCQNAVAWKNGTATVQTYTMQGDRYDVNGVKYKSFLDMETNNPVKRIYTVDEATKASGKVNRFTIRYR